MSLVVVRRIPPFRMSRVNEHTPFARGRVLGPADRRRRDMVGEKLYRLYKNSVQAQREAGVPSGPFRIRDWER